MAYYFSQRACNSIGIYLPNEYTESYEKTIGGQKGPFKAGLTHSQNISGAFAPEEYLSNELKSQRKRITKSVYDTVKPNQILDTHLELSMGRMPFLRMDGSATDGKFYAFWGHGVQTHYTHDNIQCHLILIGSTDNLTGSEYPDDSTKVDAFNFPSDPGIMTPHIAKELDIKIDPADYTAATGEPWNQDLGGAAEIAYDFTTRAYEPRPLEDGSEERRSWTSFVGECHVIAMALDIFDNSRTDTDDELKKIVLARPLSITL